MSKIQSIMTLNFSINTYQGVNYIRKEPPLLLNSPRGSPRYISPRKKNKMSVTEPADSGNGPTAQQNLQVSDPLHDADQIVSWAQLMEEEEFDPILGGDAGTDQVDGGVDSSLSPERRRHIPDTAPFRAQVANISSTHVDEELIYYFGGEELIKSVDFRKEDGNAEFEFFSRDGLMNALKKSNVEFKGRVLKVYVRQNRESLARVSSRHSQEYARHYESQDSQISGRRNDYRGNHYNSQSSLNSDKHGRYDKGNRNYSHYGTMPAGGFHDRRGGHRGGYNGGYNNENNRSFRGGPRGNNQYYDRQNSHPQHQYNNNRYEDNGGPLQRSGSYQHNRNNDYNGRQQPGYINSRSRTESHSTNFDAYSRTSSRMSVAEEPKAIARKPSANPFGDAKPVDTQTKLLELEKRQAEKEKEVASQKTEEPESAAVGDHSDEPMVQSPPVDEQQDAPRNTYQHHPHQRYNNYNPHYNQRGGHYNNRGGYQQYPQYHHNHYYEQPHPGHYDQGAPPGSVMIKKRESVDSERHKDDEVPPTDPIHYPLDEARKKSGASESAQSDLNKSSSTTTSTGPTSDLPPHPQSAQNYRGNRGRPSTKLYAPRGAHQHQLQKSATIGHIEKMPRGDGDTTVGSSDDRSQKGTNRRYQDRNYRTDGARRASLSGSESGRGSESKSRGSMKRGGRGGPGSVSGGRGRGGRRSDGDSRKTSDECNSTIPEGETVSKKEPVVTNEQENVKDEKHSDENVKHHSVEPETKSSEEEKSASQSSTGQNSTPKKKKEKKKDKKKEAKQSHMVSNKFAALMNHGE